MNFNFFMPVKVITGENCVVKNAKEFAALGKKCLLVTGKNSAKESGALDDVLRALNEYNIEYRIFDEIMQNPMLSVCAKGGRLAREFGADFIIGIGGGSPLDSAKAIAVFAANELEDEEIFRLSWKNKPLPIAAIGTTAGTGSELTPFSIMTVDRTGQKQALRHADCYMTLSFGDPKYTYSLSREFTVSTALDALSHAVEGYFCSTANGISDLFAIQATKMLCEALSEIHKNGDAPIRHEVREALYYASLYAGMTLNTCTTGFCHPMGYPLTEDYGVPHGRACAVFLPGYIARAEQFLPEKVQVLETAAGVSMEVLKQLIRDTNPVGDIEMTAEQAQEYAQRWDKSRNFAISPGGFSPAEALEVFNEFFVKA